MKIKSKVRGGLAAVAATTIRGGLAGGRCDTVIRPPRPIPGPIATLAL